MLYELQNQSLTLEKINTLCENNSINSYIQDNKIIIEAAWVKVAATIIEKDNNKYLKIEIISRPFLLTKGIVESFITQELKNRGI